MSQQKARHGPRKIVTGAGVLKLPFVNDCLSRRVHGIVRKAKLDVNVVFSSGPSFKDVLVSSSSCRPACPREEQRKEVKKSRGSPRGCRACDGRWSMYANECSVLHVMHSVW